MAQIVYIQLWQWGWFMVMDCLPRATLALVASWFIQKETQDNITIRIEGRYVWNTKYPMFLCNLNESDNLWNREMLPLVFTCIAALRYLVCAGGELDFPLIRLPAHYSKLGKLGFLKNGGVNLFDVFFLSNSSFRPWTRRSICQYWMLTLCLVTSVFP